VLVVKTGGGPPNSRDWIVEFGCGEVTEAVVATSDEHRAVGQQRSRVLRPFGYERPRGLKFERCPSAWLQEHKSCSQENQRTYDPPRED
jgi:hypothetical protein